MAAFRLGALARPVRQIRRLQARQARGGAAEAGGAAGGGARRSATGATAKRRTRARTSAAGSADEVEREMKQEAKEKWLAPSQAGRQLRELYGRRHRGAGRPRARAAPARHVRRRHRREGAASPVRRGDRQRHGRGGGRPRHLDRGERRGRRVPVRHRQRPRHPRRPAPQVQDQVRPRSDHDHAALGRQVRQQGLQHLGRPARRRRLRRQRALREAGGGGRARPAALRHDLQPRRAAGQAAEAGRHQEPARHQGALQARREDLRQGRHLQAGPPPAHGALQGLPVRRRRDPLVVRARR